MDYRHASSRRFGAVALAGLLALPLLAVPEAPACGPPIPITYFSYSKHPDLPLDAFARGTLGVLRPTYARSYLLVAYRYFLGKPLDAAEQRAAVALWSRRLGIADEPETPASTSAWLAARRTVPGVADLQQIEVFRTVQTADSRVDYLNYTDDAFVNATATLQERIKRFGANSPQVAEWVRAQDKVFSNASSEAAIPDPLTEGDALLRADRAYQIAAANFYAGRFDIAAELFAEIGRDVSSPWRQLGLYLEARALARKGSVGAGPDKLDKASLALAVERLERVVADPSLADIRKPAYRLLNLVSARLDPEARVSKLAGLLVEPNRGDAFEGDLYDYTALLDRFVPRDEENGEEIHAFEKLPPVAHGAEATEWVLLFQATGDGAWKYAVHKWRQTQSLPWLVTAITKADEDDKELGDLLAAAAKVPPQSPAYPTVAYHRARLVAEYDAAAARAILDEAIANSASPSSRNLLLAKRMAVSTNLGELLKYAQRVPAGVSDDSTDWEMPVRLRTGWFEEEYIKEMTAFLAKIEGNPMLDDDAARAINQGLPLSLMAEAVLGQGLAPSLRRELAIATWVRAGVLGDERTALAVLPALDSLAPELKAQTAAYRGATNPADREFAVVFTLLRFPGLRPYVDAGVSRQTPLPQIDSYRDNWWCAFDNGQELTKANLFKIYEQTYPEDESGAPTPPPKSEVKLYGPTFLDAAQRAALESEWKRLSTIGAGSEYLSRKALERAESRRTDPRVPEALHLAVRATRYGCPGDQTSALSKRAFDLLHSRYPKNAWTAKTKYHF
jgi:hypothetical protein